MGNFDHNHRKLKYQNIKKPAGTKYNEFVKPQKCLQPRFNFQSPTQIFNFEFVVQFLTGSR